MDKEMVNHNQVSNHIEFSEPFTNSQRERIPPVLNAAPIHYIHAPLAEELIYLPPPDLNIQAANSQPAPFSNLYDQNQQSLYIQPPLNAQPMQLNQTKKRYAGLFEDSHGIQANTPRNPIKTPAINFIDLDDIKFGLNEKRFKYGCIPTAPKSRNICLAITGVILVLVGIIIYLFYPRSPEMHFVGLVPNGAKAYQLSNYDPSNPENFKFTMNMTMTVSVINTNWYHLKVDTIDVKAYILANGTAINEQVPSPAQAILSSSAQRVWVTSKNYKSQIATGRHGSMIFPPSKKITFEVPLLIQYSPNKELGLVNDPAFNEIIQLCVDHDASKVDATSRKTKIRYEADNSVGLLKYIGYTPRQSNDFLINCPFQGELINLISYSFFN